MTIEFDVLIESQDETVDMKTALDTMQGVSDSVRLTAEFLLERHVPERLNHKSSVRTMLKKSFRGSYGHTFSLELFDEKPLKALAKIGRPTFVELFTYVLNEALYRQPISLSSKAEKILSNLEDDIDFLVEKIRGGVLGHIHEVPLKFGNDVKIRHRSGVTPRILASFDKETALYTRQTSIGDAVDLIVAITRLNIHTGNGRLQIQGGSETVAFGFQSEYRNIRLDAKKIFSQNLNDNNGVDQSEWVLLRISARPIMLPDGRVVKYLLTKIHES